MVLLEGKPPEDARGEGYLLPDKPDRRLKLQLSVDIEDLCDLASNKQEELMVEGTLGGLFGLFRACAVL